VRIAVSLLNFRPGRIGGTETYLRELIGHMAQTAGGDEIVLVVDREVAPQFRTAGVELAVIDVSARSVLCQRWLEATSRYQSRGISTFFEKLAPDAALFPQQVVFPKRIACPAVVVVHDLYHLELPENLSLLQRWYRKSIYHKSLEIADRIITVSDYTKRCLIDQCALHERASEVDTVHHGCRLPAPTSAVPACESAASPPFVYYPAISHPHKNHLQLFRTVARLRAAGRFPFRLLLSGEKTRYWAKLEREILRLDLQHVVEHLGFLPFGQVQSLFGRASAVVFPSIYEGFGIPVVEAAALGKKLITSDLEVFRELGVPDKFRIDFNDPAELHRALSIHSPTVLERPLQTWHETARQTLAILRQAARNHSALTAPVWAEPACATHSSFARAA